MSTDPAKLEQLQGLLSAVNNSLTKQDFVTAFKSVYTFVKKIKEDNDTELQGIKTQFSVLASSLKSSNSQEIKDLKNSVNTILKDSIAEMWVEQDAKLQVLDKKISLIRDGVDGIDGLDGKDGKDADENAIVQRVITMVPLDTPKQLVEKLETLKGDERLDASAIKNLPEFNGRMGGGLSRATADALYAPIGSGSGSGVDTANSPNANEFARFTDSDTIEGLTAAETRTALGLVIGTNVQAYDVDLTTWAGLTPSANAQSLVTAADYGAMKALLDLEIGTDIQAYSANLDEYAAVNPTVAGLALLDDATTAAQLVTLGFTASIAELNYTDGVTSAIQTQLDNKQPLDSDLTTIAGLTATTDNFIVSVASSWASRTPNQVRTTLGLVIGTHVQAWDSDLDTIAGLAATNDDFIQRKAGLWANRTIAQVKTDLSLTGTNSGDQTSIVGITGTKAQFDTAVTDGNILYVGDITQYTDELSQDAIGAMIDSTLVYVDATPLLTRAALTGAVTAAQGSNTTALGSFTKSQLDTAISDGNCIYVGDTITLAENTSIALDPAGSADGKWTGISITGTAGYTQAFGDVVYLDPTDSRWEAVDANSASGADGDARGILAMVVSAGTDGNPCTLLLQGVVRADAKFPTFTVNNPIYVSETAGLVTQTQPTTTDVVIRVLGFALTADEMYFNPSPTYITHT